MKNLKRGSRLTVNKDYVIEQNRTGQEHRREDIWFTTEAFKTICMYTKSDKGDMVRNYFIQAEKFLDSNKYTIINHLVKSLNQSLKDLDQADSIIEQLKLNLSGYQPFPEGGYVYIFESINVLGEILYRVGMSKGLDSRLSSHNSSLPDKLKLVATLQTNNPKAVESCLQNILNQTGKAYAKDKSFYRDITLEQLHALLDSCEDMTTVLT